MEVNKPLSLQSILRQRQQETFEGRREEITRFYQNLTLPFADDKRKFIINVFGQGGVGKTSLLRRFRSEIENFNPVVAWVDETQRDTLTVMERISEQFAHQGHTLKIFNDKHQLYNRKCQELASSSDAPQGFPAFIGTLAKTGIRFGRHTPASVILDFLDEDAVAKETSDAVAFLKRKLADKDEIQLVQKPIEVLTPLFLDCLREVAKKQLIALFFDTYEQSDEFLDNWLCDCLDERYGEIPANIVLVIAGRNELDRNRWIPYERLLMSLSLEPFTEQESHSYLARKNITDEHLIRTILHLSGGLPLLITTLATESPIAPDRIGNPSGTAVERFLKWVDNTRQRQVALNAALPRYLNQDILAELSEKKDSEMLFAWLKQMPFVLERGGSWVYHEVVRTQMLRHKFHESPDAWASLHGRLSDYYERLQSSLALNVNQQQKNPSWQDYALEILYHRLCQAPYKYLGFALNGILSALDTMFTFDTQIAFARRWANIIQQAGEDTEVAEIYNWGKLLIDGIRSLKERKFEVTAAMYTSLLENPFIDTERHQLALRLRGDAYLESEQYLKALDDYNKFLEIYSEKATVLLNRGRAYLHIERDVEALNDFILASELDTDVTERIIISAYAILSQRLNLTQVEYSRNPDLLLERLKSLGENMLKISNTLKLNPKSWIFFSVRGGFYSLAERYEEAAADITRAIELAPSEASNFQGRGRVFVSMKRYEEALADYSRAIELAPSEASNFHRRGRVFDLMKRYEEALADYSRAIELAPNDVDYISDRGELYQLVGRHEEALADYSRAIELAPNDVDYIGSRGDIYRLVGRHEEALADYSRAIELAPNDVDYIGSRGDIYRLVGRHEEALADYSRAIALNESSSINFVNMRGLVLSYLRKYAESVECYEQVIKADPDGYYCLYNIAVVMARWKGLADSQSFIDKARAKLQALEYNDNKVAVLYGLGGLEALVGNNIQALSYLEKLVPLIDSEVISWARYDLAWLDLHSNPFFQELFLKT